MASCGLLISSDLTKYKADENMAEIYSPKFEKIVGGLAGAEGPVFTRDGTFYMVAPGVQKDGKPAGEVLEVDIEGKESSVVCSPSVDGYGGIPAGCQSDQQNQLWVADMRLGILKINPQNGEFEQVVKTDTEGHPVQGCNDCIFDFHGNLWVTAPAGKIAPEKYVRSSFEENFGAVYCYANGEATRLARDYQFSNGIAVQHNADGSPSLLIVAETASKTLWAYDILGPGKLANRRVWGKLPGDHEGGPDGMDFDEEGNLLVANWGSSHLEVFGSSGGDPVARILCPFDKPSNLHFRPDSTVVYVTEHTSNGLWWFEWKCKGMKQFCDL